MINKAKKDWPEKKICIGDFFSFPRVVRPSSRNLIRFVGWNAHSRWEYTGVSVESF